MNNSKVIRGLYTSSSGMKLNSHEQEVLSDNLANINTDGFKASKNSYRSYANQIVSGDNGKALGVLNKGAVNHSTSFDFSQGPLRVTDNPLDIAIQGDGFFAVQTPSGQTMYTRNGHFLLDGNGFVVNMHGDKLLDYGKSPILINNLTATDVTVKDDGSFIVNGDYTTQIGAFTLPNGTGVTKQGGDKYSLSNSLDAPQAPGIRFHQGFLESSNVNSIKMTTDMIKTMRNFESNQQAVSAQADTLRMLIDVGRI